MARIVCALVLWVACALAQTVEGTVIDSVTGNGIPTLQVELKPPSGKTAWSGTTDAQGHFRIEGVRAGSYVAVSPSPDYMPDGAPHLLQVTAASDPVKLEVRLLPLARLSGRVVDGRTAVANARLELAGAGKLIEGSTDASGKFDLRLLPGSYTLSAIPPDGLKPPDPSPDDPRVTVWTRTYYPAGANSQAAAKIAARFGGIVSGIELKLLAVPVHSLRGVLLGPDGTPGSKVAIALSADEGPPAHRTESGPGGVFEFPSVVDGEWHLTAQAEAGGAKLRASQWIEMAGRSIEGLRLRLSAPFTIHGRVVMEPAASPLPTRMPVIFLAPRLGRVGRQAWMEDWMRRPDMHFLEPESTPGQVHGEILDSFFFNGFPSGRPDSAGNFTVPDVYPGSYRIFLMPPPPFPYYLDALRVGETDLATDEVEVHSGAPPIYVVYKSNGGSVRGTIEKCAAGPVLLVPQDKTKQRLGFLRSAQCDSGGRYEITAVRPGEYYVLAFQESGPLPELKEAEVSQSGKVTVRAGEASLADVRATPRPF